MIDWLMIDWLMIDWKMIDWLIDFAFVGSYSQQYPEVCGINHTMYSSCIQIDWLIDWLVYWLLCRRRSSRTWRSTWPRSRPTWSTMAGRSRQTGWWSTRCIYYSGRPCLPSPLPSPFSLPCGIPCPLPSPLLTLLPSHFSTILYSYIFAFLPLLLLFFNKPKYPVRDLFFFLKNIQRIIVSLSICPKSLFCSLWYSSKHIASIFFNLM